MNKYKSGILFLLVFMHVSLKYMSAQSLPQRFDEIYNLIEQKEYDKAYAELRQYQNYYPEHVATYYFLGEISSYWIKNYDPLQEFDEIEKLANDAVRLYYGLALHYLTPKNFRTYKRYFTEFENEEGKITDVEIVNAIKSKQKTLELYVDNIKTIYKYYSGSVYNYHTCVKTFRELVYENEKEKDIYLKNSPSINSKLDLIEHCFDSTLHYFSLYKAALDSFPLNGYSQNYTLHPVVTYRLDGLSQANFLKNDIELWDYKQWVSKVRKFKTEDISILFQRTIEIEKQFRNLEADVSKGMDLSIPKLVDESLIYFAKKFDYNTFFEDYFRYKELRLDYLDMYNSPYNVDYYSDTISSKLIVGYFCNMLNKHTEVMDRGAKTINLLTKPTYVKYQEFFDKYYGNEIVTKQLLVREIENTELIYSDITKNLKSYFVKKDSIENPDIVICKQLATNGAGKYVFTHVEKVSDFYYVAGYDESVTPSNACVAKVNSNFNIEWIKTFSIPYKDISGNEYAAINKCYSLKATDDECFAVITLKDTTDTLMRIQNYLVGLDKKGIAFLNVPVSSSQIPRFLDYDVLNQEIIIAFKGKRDEYPYGEFGALGLYCFDKKGANLWQSSLSLDGSIIKIFKESDSYTCFGNYHSIMKNTSIVGLPENTLSIFSCNISNRGVVNDIINYKFTKSVTASVIHKHSSNQYFIFGTVPGEPNTAFSLENLIYLKFNTQRELQYSSFK